MIFVLIVAHVHVHVASEDRVVLRGLKVHEDLEVLQDNQEWVYQVRRVQLVQSDLLALKDQ